MPMPERAGDPPQEDGHRDGAPVDEEEGGDGDDVESGHGNGGDPVDLAVGGLSAINLGNWNHVGIRQYQEPRTTAL